jgi:epoxide hydrolase-like predicted phosphatase
MITAIVSDFGGVLTTPLHNSFAAFHEHTQIPPTALGEALAAIAVRNGANPLYELEMGRVTEPAFLAELDGELSAALGRPVDMASFSDLYWAHLGPNPALIDYMYALRHERGYRLAMLTNNVREWEPRWRAMLAVDEIFELVVDSSAVGMRKPDPAIYALTLERLGLVAEQCLFVDDFAHNCEAAAAAGMVAVHFRENDQAIAEIEAALSPAVASPR